MTPDFTPYSIDSLWLDRAPKPRTLLVVYPHPDDESFGNGGTIARYVAQGVAVHYACATRGECGTILFRPTACVVLKGKSTPIEVWEPLQDGEVSSDFLARYGEAYAMLKMGSKGAAGLLEGLARDRPDDPCIAFHLQRVRQGVFGDTVIMTEK